jgi:hypothetical protein
MSNLSNFYRDLKGEPAQDIMDMSKTQKYPIGWPLLWYVVIWFSLLHLVEH